MNVEFYVAQDDLVASGPLETGTAAEALELSIEKWRFVVLWIEANGRKLNNGGGTTCALCQKVFSQRDKCSLCPVFTRTKKHYCYVTPYTRYARCTRPESALRAARDELAFLESLRPLVAAGDAGA